MRCRGGKVNRAILKFLLKNGIQICAIPKWKAKDRLFEICRKNFYRTSIANHRTSAVLEYSNQDSFNLTASIQS